MAKLFDQIKNQITPQSFVPCKEKSPPLHGICPGTFGEIVQGKLDNSNFLITLPIDRYSFAIFNERPESASISTPVGKWKVKKAIDLLSRELGYPTKGILRIVSELLPGKGMASSTADIVVATQCILSCTNVSPPQYVEWLARVCVEVEPSDGVMYKGMVAFDHTRGKVIDSFGYCHFVIIGQILPGVVDTISHDSKSIAYTSTEKSTFAEIFRFAKTGIKEGNIPLIGRAASESARINQRYLPKPYFNEVIEISQRHNCAGVVVAHSGTVIGIIVDPNRNDYESTVMHIWSELRDLYNQEPEFFNSVSGGPRVGFLNHPHNIPSKDTNPIDEYILPLQSQESYSSSFSTKLAGIEDA